jgi:ABC-type multidrug transport system fused ATPase/permease subunit
VHADQILVMDQGKIIERGTHQQLLQANGRYTSMWQMQESSPINPDESDAN